MNTQLTVTGISIPPLVSSAIHDDRPLAWEEDALFLHLLGAFSAVRVSHQF